MLRARIRHMERPARHGVLPFAIAAIDLSLPGGGLARGALHEITGAGGDEEDGAAAAGFAAGILARLGVAPALPAPTPTFPRPLPNPPPQAGEGRVGAKREREGPAAEPWEDGGRHRRSFPGGGIVLWCLKRPDLYGPGLLAHGLDPARLVLVTARRDDEILWAVEEGLRSGAAAGLAAVVGEIGHLPMVAGRRLQLAAEASGVTAFMLRRWRNATEAATERDRPSAALTRWRVAALPSTEIVDEPGIAHGSSPWAEGPRARWLVELRRVRGGAPGSWDVEVADATGHVCLSAELADRPAAPSWVSAEPWQRRAG